MVRLVRSLSPKASPLVLAGLTAVVVGCRPPSASSTGPETNPAPVEVSGESAPLPKTPGGGKAAELLQTADTLLREGRLEESRQILQQLTKDNPDLEEGFFSLGFVLGKLGRTEEAMAAYEATIRLVPEYAQAHNNLGNILVKLKRPLDALPHFEAALNVDDRNHLTYNNLGTAYANLGRFTEAIPQFNRAVQLNAEYPDAWFNLGRCFVETGHYQEAILPLQTALKLKPDLTVARKLLSEIQTRVRAKRPDLLDTPSRRSRPQNDP